MHRLAIIWIFSIFFCLGCNPYQELPVPLYFDQTFSPLERGAIMGALDEWNKKARPRLRHETDIFFYRDDISTFVNQSSIDRDKRIIFNVAPDTVCPPLHICEEKSGYGTFGFIFLFTPEMQNKVISRTESGEINFDYVAYFRKVRSVSIHELGHLLGLMHFSHLPGIMNKKVPLGTEERPFDLTEADLEAFCLIYECR